jgi:hypothetical protein
MIVSINIMPKAYRKGLVEVDVKLGSEKLIRRILLLVVFL